ncbi:hypothetical protein D6D13_08033 [Aureobasidium pullulans]|uniref:DDE-1 domain-containing protein n=1 Tax=Aureobasidium pullulans TaxID=5580 RepID=A0A4S9CAV7_AURPU|nr:hypothetical protein D6D13_08033 [Aureobasidium pullulans]
MKRFKVQPVNIHNIDEHGLGLGMSQSHQVLGEAKKTKRGRKRKQTRTTSSETQEWVSVIECISAGGFSPEPVIIFKGKSDILNWFPEPVPPFKYTHSNKAWTNNEIAIYWLDEVFLPQTKPHPWVHRILVYDGHKSHVSATFELKCKKAKVICMKLPPHTSDVLQPLDLAMFSPLKTKYRSKLKALQHSSDGAPTKKKDFLKIYHEARIEKINTKSMHKCFETAGLVPWNPESVISRDEVRKRPITPPLPPISSLFNTPQHSHQVPQYLEDLSARRDLSVEDQNQRLKRACRKANKAFETQAIELARLQLELKSKNKTITDLVSEKPLMRVQAPRFKHLVDQKTIEAAQEKYRLANAPAKPRAAPRQRDKMTA